VFEFVIASFPVEQRDKYYFYISYERITLSLLIKRREEFARQNAK